MRGGTCELELCAAETIALDTSEPRTEWLCISVEIASQQRERNQRVCIIFGTSVWEEGREVEMY